MARPPNYNHERMERDRAKAAKKAEKQTAKANARKTDEGTLEQNENPPEGALSD